LPPEIINIDELLIGILYFRADRGFLHEKGFSFIVLFIPFETYFSSPLPVIITSVECSLMFGVEFIGFENSLVEILKSLLMSYHYIPIYTIIFFKIRPEFKYSHVV